jgi:hypothetical protein
MMRHPNAHPPRPGRWRVALAAVALTGLLAGCGSGTPPRPAATSPARQPPARTAARTGQPPAIRPGQLPELRSTAHLAVVHWTLLAITGGGRALHLAADWACGLPPVGEHLTQSHSEVIVILYARRLPPGSACSLAGGTAIIMVSLAAPLAGRRLLS